MKMVRILMVMMATFTLSGCVDNTTIVEVKKDGSGFVTEVTYMSPAMDQMMNQMMAGMASAMSNGLSGGEAKLETKAAKPGAAMLLERKQYESKAKAMGEGVSVCNIQAMTRKDGAPGVRVDYAYKDVTKLKIEAGSPSQQSPMPPSSGNELMSEKKGKPLTFGFVPGMPSKLTIIMPPEEASKNNAATLEPALGNPGSAGGSNGAEDQAGMAMMKSMFKDFHLVLRIKVGGEIEHTNASYVQTGDTNRKKQYVTIYDVSFGELLSDAKYADKLGNMMAMGGDPSSAKDALKNLPGIKLETANQIEIEFR
jgi:hypothetical protein